MAPGGAGYVWVGDIGDNDSRRSSVEIARVPVGRGDRTVHPTTYRLTYPDGPADAETLLRDPASGRLYIATKSVFGGVLYAVPASLDASGSNRLRAVGRVLPVATDGAFFPDGRHVVVRSYTTAVVYAWPSLQPVGSFALPHERQGEGIAVADDGAVYVDSEGPGSPVLEVTLPPEDRGGCPARGLRGPCVAAGVPGRRTGLRTAPPLRGPSRRQTSRCIVTRGRGWPVACSDWPRSSSCSAPSAPADPRPARPRYFAASRHPGDGVRGASAAKYRVTGDLRGMEGGSTGYVVAMARLRRSSPDDPGWRRRRAGKGFVYLDQDGVRLPAEDVERVKGLVIPPAWQDVWICPWPHGHLQAVGTDVAGRRQYLYHPDWRVQRDTAKHARVLEFGKVLSRAREQVLLDLGTEGMSHDRACAVAVRLLDLGYFRIGNDVYADTNGSFGLTTLQRRHVSRHGDGMEFCFVGKSGIEHCITITDPATVEALDVMRRRRAPADEELLAWKERGRWHDLTSDHVNDYVRRATGIEATAKDFRTWHATVIAAAALAESEEPGHDQGLAQAGRGGGDEGGGGVPREHPGLGPVVVRRPPGGRRLRGGPHDPGRRTPEGGDAGRAAGGARAGSAATAEGLLSVPVEAARGGRWGHGGHRRAGRHHRAGRRRGRERRQPGDARWGRRRRRDPPRGWSGRARRTARPASRTGWRPATRGGRRQGTCRRAG